MFPHPLPWYVAGPLIGLVVPTLLLVGNKPFGVSSNFRALCAAIVPGRIDFFRYDWKGRDSWNLAFFAGTLAGAFIASLAAPIATVTIAPDTVMALHNLGLTDLSGLAPREIFSWSSLLTLKGFVSIAIGGFLVGFGSSYAGGCTSGHAISGLAHLQLSSLIAVCGFFAGGLFTTHLLLPFLFR